MADLPSDASRLGRVLLGMQVVEEVEVGRGELAYRFACEAVRTHKALDSFDDDLRFYTSEARPVCLSRLRCKGGRVVRA